MGSAKSKIVSGPDTMKPLILMICTSEIDDFTQSWTYAPDSIDFIHGRYLLGSVGDWTALAKDAYRCLKPGGFFESYEASPFISSEDDSVKDTSALGQWGKLFVEGGKKLGQPFTVVPDGTQKKALEEAGFVEIDEWNFNVRALPFPGTPVIVHTHRYVFIIGTAWPMAEGGKVERNRDLRSACSRK